jgi:hypothetical protein
VLFEKKNLQTPEPFDYCIKAFEGTTAEQPPYKKSRASEGKRKFLRLQIRKSKHPLSINDLV